MSQGELKKVESTWNDKVHPMYGPIHVYQPLAEAEESLIKILQILAEAGMDGLHYNAQATQIEESFNTIGSLNAYISSLI